MGWATVQGGRGTLPPTFFAAPERASAEQLADAVRAGAESPVLTALLRTVGGFVAVLDSHRQVVAINDGLLRFLGVDDPAEVLGLRPGEAMRCVHAHDHPAGCGTGRLCGTCGAAIAIVLSQQSGGAVERECLLTVGDDGGEALELAVRAMPLEVGRHRLTLLFLRDIRGEKRREALERVFFHDVMNTLQVLLGCCDLARQAPSDALPALAQRIGSLAEALADEVRNQQILAQIEAGAYAPERRPASAGRLLADAEETVLATEAARDRTLRAWGPPADLTITTDPALVHRVLVNMVKNALEATPPGGEVKFWCERSASSVSWHVWNEGQIPEHVAPRIFQRYFSTKGGAGRGLGTYGMKLLGETHLGGEVRFSSSGTGGTLFTFSLPLREH